MGNELKYFLIGDGPVTKAVGKVMELFDVKDCDSNGFNIMVLADKDSEDNNEKQKKFLSTLKDKSNGNETLIYLETLKDAEKDDVGQFKHPLSFLSEVYKTYRIPLEQFSLAELGLIIENIRKRKD